MRHATGGSRVVTALICLLLLLRILPDWLLALPLSVAGAVALRYRNVWGAVMVHFGFDFLIFLPLADATTRL